VLHSSRRCPLAGLAGAAAAGPSPVLQTLDYANTRYSKLDQINAKNVKDLQVAWTFSTGVLRGHEGAPLVVGNVLYVHTPFPNIVYALDLDHEAGRSCGSYEPKQDRERDRRSCAVTRSPGAWPTPTAAVPAAG
jgi:glucose dehydrogenase